MNLELPFVLSMLRELFTCSILDPLYAIHMNISSDTVDQLLGTEKPGAQCWWHNEQWKPQWLQTPVAWLNNIIERGGATTHASGIQSATYLQSEDDSRSRSVCLSADFDIGITLISLEFNENEKQLVIGYCDRMIRVFTSIISEDFEGRLSGRIALKYVFNVAEQIHTINVRRMSTREYELIVSQPGGNLLRFNPNEENGNFERGWVLWWFVEFRPYFGNWDVRPWNDRLDRSDLCG
jgi:hypothetical protein